MTKEENQTFMEDLLALRGINGFSEHDLDRLNQIAPLITPKLAELTDQFYCQLERSPHTAPYLEGRVQLLKKTHLEWLTSLFTTRLEEDYLAAQWAIGRVHAKMHIAPIFVASSMSYLRSEFPKLLDSELLSEMNHSKDELISSVLKMLDIVHFVIDQSYYDRLREVTGISKALLHRLMK